MIKLLVGMIGSGKSTWCRKAALNGDLVVNDDAIVSMLHGDQYTLYNKKLKPLYKSIESHIVHIAVVMGKNVVIDRGVNVQISARKRFIALAKSLDVKIIAVIFPKQTAQEHATRRFNNDPRGHTLEYWLNVAREHLDVYQKPTLEEGFDAIKVVKWEPIEN